MTLTIAPETLQPNAQKLDAQALQRAVPRYTSYPTAPHFSADIGQGAALSWLKALPKGARLSLYLHIPFCDTLCWFCGCHTRMVRRYSPVSAYLDALEDEIRAVASALPEGAVVTALHWGGGSPTMLAPEDILRLTNSLRSAFPFDSRVEFAVEIDPRGMDDAKLDALAASGLTRASIGVQDFDERVQQAINRFQSFAETQVVVEGLRQRGVRSLNIDMLYGLPHQTTRVLLRSLDAVLSLKPDRVALFGYAHVPWMKKHQAMIPEEALPGMQERIASAEGAAARLVEAGYCRIGIDHFALPTDGLAQAAASGTLRRNFQGYTDDASDALIGLGASAISQFPQGFIQNEVGGQAYARKVAETGSAALRGLVLSADDGLRADAIEDIMCNLRFSGARLKARHGALAEPLIAEAEALLLAENPAWLVATEDGFRVTEAGRPCLRLIAAHFDAYLEKGTGRHSSAL